MATAETARLIAELSLDPRKYNAGVSKALASTGKLESSFSRIGRTAGQGLRTAGRNAALIGVGAAAGVAAFAKKGIESLAELEDAITAVDGAIDQVRPNWTTTGADIAKVANDIERRVGAAFDDKDIIAGTEGLIRYGKVAQANLEPAMEVMTDLAARTGSVDSASVLLGKALADPTKAAGKLSRQGIILTKQQQKQIKAMVEAGDVAGAQAVVLEQVEKSTKGAAAASQGPYRRSLAVLADVTEDAQRALGEGFLPVIEKVADLLAGELVKPGTIDNIRNFGKGLASGLDDLVSIARQLPWGTIGSSLKLGAEGAQTILRMFSSMPPWVQTAVLTGWGLNKLTGGALGTIVSEIGKGVIKGVLGMNAGVVNIKAGTVVGPGGVTPTSPTSPKSSPPVGFLGSLGIAAIVAAVSEGTTQGVREMAKGQGIKAEISNPAAFGFAGAVGTLQNLLGVGSELLNVAQNGKPDQETQKKISTLGVTFGRQTGQVKSATDRVKAATAEVKRETTRGATQTQATQRTTAAAIQATERTNTANLISAIYRAQPVVNVSVSGTAVTRTVTHQTRRGPSGGSRNSDSNGSGTLGNGGP